MRNPEYHGRGNGGRSFFSVIFRGVGLALLAGGVIYGCVILAFVVRAVHTGGKVVRMHSVQNSVPLMGKNDTGIFYYPVVKFTTPSGKVFEFEAAAGSQRKQYAVGDSVPVVYDPSHPADGRVDTFWGVWGAPTILVGIGVAFLVLGFLAPFGFGNMPRRLRGS